MDMAPLHSLSTTVVLIHMNTILSGAHALHIAHPSPRPRMPGHFEGNCRNRLLYNELYSASGDGNDITSNRNFAVDTEKVTDSTMTSTSTSFLRTVDNFGMKLKPWALSAYQRSLNYSNIANTINGEEEGTGEQEKKSMKRTSNFKSILCRIQSNLLWLLYILYRGYRGFFVILPAVFREVYAKLNDSDLVVDVYDDEGMEEREYAVNANATSQKEQLQQPMKLRTRITISILSGILTLSYVVSGALRVFGKFIKTFTNTTSLESSFEAAAEEVIDNENKLRSKLK